MRTTLVTMTRGDRHRWFDLMLASVPRSAAHEVVVVPEEASPLEWAERRIEALRSASTPFVAFLDDDDLLHPGAVEACEQALDAMDAGVAFTLEQRIDEQGNVVEPAMRRQRFYTEVRFCPRAIHHLAVMRREALPDDALDIEREFGFGLEWWVKARVAFAAGAVQVRQVGYSWRQRAGQLSATVSWQARYAAAQRRIGDLLQVHVGARSVAPIPVFRPSA